MTRSEFVNVALFWGWWTTCEAVWIARLWSSRSRVLGKVVCRIPGARRIGRGMCENRVETLLEVVRCTGVPAEVAPDENQLVDRWHRIVAGRCVSALLQGVPLFIALFPFAWTTSFAPITSTPLWMCAAVAGFALLSMTLMAADIRAAAVSDAAGIAAVEAFGFLELLLMRNDRRTQESALDVHARLFARLCRALRAQARYTARKMPPAARARVRETTERLIAALADADQRYLFGEGADRDAAVRDLSRLVAGALRHSCVPRDRRDSLVIIDPSLLADAPASDETVTAIEPFRNRLLVGAGRLTVAVAFLTVAYLFRGEGAAAGLLVVAGVLSAAPVFPPLTQVLYRAWDLLPGGGAPAATEEPNLPASDLTAPCRHHCADHSAVTVGSRPVG